MPIRQTERGFDVYAEFKDTYGGKIRVQESSSAESPRVWVFVDSGPYWSQDKGQASMHLDMETVDVLIAALQEWKDAQEA